MTFLILTHCCFQIIILPPISYFSKEACYLAIPCQPSTFHTRTKTPLSIMASLVSLHIHWWLRHMTCSSVSFPKSYCYSVWSVYRTLSNSLTFTNSGFSSLTMNFYHSISHFLPLFSTVFGTLCVVYVYLPPPNSLLFCCSFVNPIQSRWLFPCRYRKSLCLAIAHSESTPLWFLCSYM